ALAPLRAGIAQCDQAGGRCGAGCCGSGRGGLDGGSKDGPKDDPAGNPCDASGAVTGNSRLRIGGSAAGRVAGVSSGSSIETIASTSDTVSGRVRASDV